MKLTNIAITRVLVITVLLMCLQNSEATTGIAKYIMGGQQAARGQFPWQVQIGTIVGDVFSSCGGSIISSRWIVTAAHCHKGRLPTVVYCGSLMNGGNDAELVVSEFDAFIKHEAYTKERRKDDFLYVNTDIALIKLTEPLTWSENIQPVDLPTRSQDYPLPEGSIIVTSGWGRLSSGDESKNIPPVHSRTLMYIEFELREDEYCEEHFYVCSKYYPYRSVLKGDSGGPWVWMDPQGVNRLVGVTMGHYRREAGINFWGASVAGYLDWIHDHTGIEIED